MITTASKSVTSAATLFTQDCNLYRSVSVNVTSIGIGNTISYEVSHDAGATWVAAYGVSTGAVPTRAATSEAVETRIFNVNGMWFRARVSTYGSGTVTAQAVFSEEMAEGAVLNLTTLTGDAITVEASPVLPVPYTDVSGTITTGGTAQSLASANASRKGFSIQNISTGDLWVRAGGVAAVGVGVKVPAGALYEFSYPPSQAISIFGAVTGQAFTAQDF